ncbi:cation:proton antiporter [Roseateles terrae]|uniref:Kef-type K+ transport system membrane component KefB n=1 Tax=Roseateles terrae TaxID=431060 RepID=A0ABR6GQ59_9BURK|nr:cation:proton antiporter [Roseateles terrae]MBB3194265.1 Kef-type K+ transport system membrane component KefB [Roseateles terrae]OWQ88108.1 cation/H(+) antiporter [Roseateles terrae]
MGTTELFLIALAVTLAVPYLIWRLGGTDQFAPLVVVQILTGVLLGPGLLGGVFPEAFQALFKPDVVQALNGVSWWAVILFVWLAGMELDLGKAWAHRVESGITAGLALGVPMVFGALAALVLLGLGDQWMGAAAQRWQFVVGVGMSCAVTALPILILLMEKLDILRQPMGQRILRYASLDDLAIWTVLAVILMDWERVGRQLLFLLAFGVATVLMRRLMRMLSRADRWMAGLVWLVLCAFGADWCGLHYMVGAFLAGVVMDAEWFEEAERDALRHHVLLVLMPIYFLSSGLRTRWGVEGGLVFAAAGLLLVASVSGKLLGVQAAGRLLRWGPGEASIIGWLLQTKALIMIIFANVLLDKQIISGETFTALLLMAVASTVLTMPMVASRLARIKALVLRAS